MIKQKIKSLLMAPVHSARRAQARSVVPQLIQDDNPKLRAVGQALEALLNNSFPQQELDLLSAIERKRDRLLRSNERVDVVDYGAGKPNSNRSDEEMARGVRSTALVSDLCRVSKPEFWAKVMFRVVRSLKPERCVELGACVGISASYQGAALSLNGSGRLTTIEGSPEVARIARETVSSLGYDNVRVVEGAFREVLKRTLEEEAPVDFLFNDGHHDRNAVLKYFEDALPHLSEDAVIIFDDISWSKGMRSAWGEIERDRRVAASIDLHTMGIAVLGSVQQDKKCFSMPL